MEDIPASIKTNEEVAKGTLWVEYDLLGKTVTFAPGQHFHVILPSGTKHHFTIVNSPNSKGILSQITRIRDTAFKQELEKLPVGTKVMVGKIKGEFTLPKSTRTPLVFTALGIGITPYLSMLDYIEEEKLPYDITLLYSDSDVESMVRKSELETLSKKLGFKLVETITKDPNWKGESKHIDEAFIRKYIDDPKKYLYYVSGPPAAVLAVSTSLKAMGIAEDQIKTEDFTGYASSAPQKTFGTMISEGLQYPKRFLEGRFGKTLGTYVDDTGKERKLSLICTHLGCVVQWNDKDKTWDCPCHGSRYTKEGKVFQGPAKKDLAKIS